MQAVWGVASSWARKNESLQRCESADEAEKSKNLKSRGNSPHKNGL